MNKEIEPPSADGAAPSDQSKRSGYSDLEYVSLELDGKTYGGWYRQLADGQLELLAIGNIRSQRRSNGTAMDQARGMLEEFVRAARSNGLSEHESRDVSISSGGSGEAKAQGQAQSTLGDLLYCDKTKSRARTEFQVCRPIMLTSRSSASGPKNPQSSWPIMWLRTPGRWSICALSALPIMS